MGETVEYPSNGTPGQGYLAPPESGRGPGLVLIQEWWGVNDQIREACDRYAGAGFACLAPDLYRGVVTREPDEAAKMMMSLNLERAAKDMVGAVSYLAAHPSVSSRRVGVIGHCMGGGLALWLATLAPEQVAAVAPCYGVIPWPAAQPDYTRLAAAVQGHYAEHDDFAGPEQVRKLEEELRGLGKDVEFFTYPGTQHAFTNHHRPEVYDEAACDLVFDRTVEFLRRHLT